MPCCRSVLVQFPMQDDVTALKALAIAQRHGLTGAAAGLARRLGMAAAARGHTAAALQWMMRAHDPTRCAELVAPLLARVQQQLLEQVGLQCLLVYPVKCYWCSMRVRACLGFSATVVEQHFPKVSPADAHAVGYTDVPVAAVVAILYLLLYLNTGWQLPSSATGHT